MSALAALRIAVVPEGRDGVWLADRESLKAWIRQQAESHEPCVGPDGYDDDPGYLIHNFSTANPGVALGADHSWESVLVDIDNADRVAVLTGDSQRGNMGHALALIMPAKETRFGELPERLEMYDIGEITEADLDVSA